jgi:hypothetical protein
MNISRHFICLLAAVALLGVASCAKRDEARQQQRLEQEQRDERDTAAANKAITDMDNKIGRKRPTMDLGLPPDTGNGTTQKSPQQP